MEPVLTLANQYKGEFQDEYTQLRKRVLAARDELTAKAQAYQKQLTDMQPVLQKHKEEVVGVLKNQAPVADLDTAKLMATFMWTAVLLVGATIGGIFGGTLLAPILSLFVSGFYAFVAAYIALPAAMFYYMRKPVEQNKQNDSDRRHALFAFSVVEGLLAGFVLSNRALIGAPPLAALTPAIMGLGAQIGSSVIGKDRIKLLGVTLGGGFMLHMVLGFVLGLSFPYILLALLYTTTGFVALQLYLKNVGKDTVFTHNYQLGFIYAVLVSQLLVYTIFGGEPSEMAAAAKESNNQQ